MYNDDLIRAFKDAESYNDQLEKLLDDQDYEYDPDTADSSEGLIMDAQNQLMAALLQFIQDAKDIL